MRLNKKVGMIVLIWILALPARATIARLQALGMDETDNEGSYYIDDNRNIFLNVANINQYRDSLLFDWGNEGQSLAGSAIQVDTDSSPKGKGGFLKSMGSFTYGLYLGNESNTSALLRGVATGAAAVPAQDLLDGSDNQLDLFLGARGDSLDWGINLVYTKDKNDANSSEDNGYALRMGAKASSWDAFLNLSVGSKSEKTTDLSSFAPIFNTTAELNGVTETTHKFDGKLGFHLGGSYKFDNEMKVYAFVKKFDWEQSDSAPVLVTDVSGASATLDAALRNKGQQGTVDGGFLTYAVGLGRVHDLGSGKLFTSLEYRHKSIEVEFKNKAEAENVFIPFTIGYEVKATDWLTLRGSIRQYLYGYRKNRNYSSLNAVAGSATGLAAQQFGSDTGDQKITFDNTTDVNAGLSLNFGKLVIDGLIGVSGPDGNVDGDESGVLSTDRLMSRVGMTYSF